MIPINVIMRFIDFNQFFVEYRFRSDKEIASRRICAPNNSGSTVNLYRKFTLSEEPIKDRKITRKDGVFGGALGVCFSYQYNGTGSGRNQAIVDTSTKWHTVCLVKKDFSCFFSSKSVLCFLSSSRSIGNVKVMNLH